jgi:hypothetical protein
MSFKGLFGLLLPVFLAAAPVSVSAKEVDRVPAVEAPAPTHEGSLVLQGELVRGVETCGQSAGTPMGVLGEGIAEDSASSTLQGSFCMCDRCVCSSCDCSGGVFRVRCCALALGDICVAISICDCLQC